MSSSRFAVLALILATTFTPAAFAQTPSPAAAPAAPAAMPAPPVISNDVSKAVSSLYAIDKNHAAIIFRVSHLGTSFYRGRYNDFDAKINLNAAMPEKSTLDVTLNPVSVDTHNAKLEGEIRDWFKVSQFTTVTFKSTKLTRTGPNIGELEGDLTMLGQTHPLKLAVTFQGYGLHMVTKKPTFGISAVGTLKRSQWGISYGLPMVGDDVELQIDAEFNMADATPPAPTPVAPSAPAAAPAPVPPK